MAQAPGGTGNPVPPEIPDDPDAIDKALKRVKATFMTGKTKPYKYRIAQLTNLKKGMLAMEKELTTALTNDLAREDFVSWMYEIHPLYAEIDDAVANLKTWMQEKSVDLSLAIGPGKSGIIQEPLGVIGVMGSWNFPLAVSLGPVISAMAAGNAIVLKPSEMAPFSAKAMKSLFARHLDLNAYQCVNG
jgi:aldehyde dehydrogenase (NAD+)